MAGITLRKKMSEHLQICLLFVSWGHATDFKDSLTSCRERKTKYAKKATPLSPGSHCHADMVDWLDLNFTPMFMSLIFDSQGGIWEEVKMNDPGKENLKRTKGRMGSLETRNETAETDRRTASRKQTVHSSSDQTTVGAFGVIACGLKAIIIDINIDVNNDDDDYEEWCCCCLLVS